MFFYSLYILFMLYTEVGNQPFGEGPLIVLTNGVGGSCVFLHTTSNLYIYTKRNCHRNEETFL